MDINGFKTIVRMSLSDYFHEKLLSACAIMGLAAVLAPLLVLFGVKNGIISTMSERLIKDPRNLEITPVGSGRYNEAWFNDLKKHGNVSFIIPKTRSIAANIILFREADGQYFSLGVDVIPTGEGDPLLEKWGKTPLESDAVTLSNSAARKLKADVGDVIQGRIGRSYNGVKEQVSIPLKIVSILPLEAYAVDAAFIRLDLLTAIEDYRDGFAAPLFNWPGREKPAGERQYPSFRLFADSIYDVSGLRDYLESEGLEVYTRAEEIEVVKRLDQSFTIIFQLISFVAIVGYFASMMSSVLANVNRKSRHLGIMRLIGYSTMNMIWFPITQSAATSLIGTSTAVILYYIAEATINSLFGQYLQPGEHVCHLSAFHVSIAFGLTVSMAVLASAYSAYRVSRIEPSEVIRDV